jgi:hypothetical protein
VEEPSKTPRCFVLMPFGDPRDRYYKQIYEPAISDAGLQPVRGDSIFRSSPIMGDIWRFVQESTVLLADLTGRNPNVFYELGLAHAIGKPVVLAAETMDDVPFDLRGLRVITFDRNDPEWGVALRACITSSLKETLNDILGAVPPMFLARTDSHTPARRESPLELQVRALAEEITALRRESHQAAPSQRATASQDIFIGHMTIKLKRFDAEMPAVIETIASMVQRILGPCEIKHPDSLTLIFDPASGRDVPKRTLEAFVTFVKDLGVESVDDAPF